MHPQHQLLKDLLHIASLVERKVLNVNDIPPRDLVHMGQFVMLKNVGYTPSRKSAESIIKNFSFYQ